MNPFASWGINLNPFKKKQTHSSVVERRVQMPDGEYKVIFSVKTKNLKKYRKYHNCMDTANLHNEHSSAKRANMYHQLKGKYVYDGEVNVATLQITEEAKLTVFMTDETKFPQMDSLMNIFINFLTPLK